MPLSYLFFSLCSLVYILGDFRVAVLFPELEQIKNTYLIRIGRIRTKSFQLLLIFSFPALLFTKKTSLEAYRKYTNYYAFQRERARFVQGLRTEPLRTVLSTSEEKISGFLYIEKKDAGGLKMSYRIYALALVGWGISFLIAFFLAGKYFLIF